MALAKKHEHLILESAQTKSSGYPQTDQKAEILASKSSLQDPRKHLSVTQENKKINSCKHTQTYCTA